MLLIGSRFIVDFICCGPICCGSICCGPNCCWEKCDYAPPADCIKDVENSEWRYIEELGYYRAFRKSGKFIHRPFSLNCFTTAHDSTVID